MKYPILTLTCMWISGACFGGVFLHLYHLNQQKNSIPYWVQKGFVQSDAALLGWKSCQEAYGIYFDQTNLSWACSRPPGLSTNNGHILHELVIPSWKF